MQGNIIYPCGISRILPMSIQVNHNGEVLEAGATMRRLISNEVNFCDIFLIERPFKFAGGFREIYQNITNCERLMVRLSRNPGTVLRGSGAALSDEIFLFNFGFGSGLSEAVRVLKLSDADFSPSDLAMELLFLNEANLAVQNELARFNLHLEEAKKAAEVQAYTDPLTGLYNRRGLDVALNSAIREAEHLPFALAHIDLDYFKMVNDKYGHAAGDHVLKKVAKILRQETRSCDTVARVGGDEFVLVLPGQSHEGALQRLGERMISRIEQDIEYGESKLKISASIGVSVSSSRPDYDAESMLSDADEALYSAKNAGRGRVDINKLSGWSFMVQR